MSLKELMILAAIIVGGFFVSFIIFGGTIGIEIFCDVIIAIIVIALLIKIITNK